MSINHCLDSRKLCMIQIFESAQRRTGCLFNFVLLQTLSAHNERMVNNFVFPFSHFQFFKNIVLFTSYLDAHLFII